MAKLVLPLEFHIRPGWCTRWPNRREKCAEKR